MNAKKVIGLIVTGILGALTLINLLKLIFLDLNGLIQTRNGAYVAGRIFGSAIIPVVCIFIFIKIILKIKEEKTYKS